MDSPDLMPEAYENMILLDQMDDAGMGDDCGSPDACVPPSHQVLAHSKSRIFFLLKSSHFQMCVLQDFVIMEGKRKRRGKVDDQISFEQINGLPTDQITSRLLGCRHAQDLKDISKSPLRLFSLPKSMYCTGNFLSVYLGNILKTYQESKRKQHQKKRKRMPNEPDVEEVHAMCDYHGSPQGYGQGYGFAEDDQNLQFGQHRKQKDTPIEIERYK